MRTKRLLSVAAIAGLCMTAIALPASANSATVPTSTTPSAPSSATTNAVQAETERLYELAEEQTEAEAKAIANAKGPSVALVDPATGEYLAAYSTSSIIAPMALTQRGPGCASLDACATTSSGIKLGWYGTGTVVGITVNNVTRVYSGDRTSTWALPNGRFDFIAAYKTIIYSSPSTILGLTRR